MNDSTIEQLDARDQELVAAAREALKTAYAPYSKVQVGAALLTPDGCIITGSNVENAAFGSTICAERMAVGRANAEGHRAFEAVAIAAESTRLDPDAVMAPCGPCRQVLLEFSRASGTATRVLMAAADGRVTVSDVEELLPLAFGPDRLGDP